jgi:hypothetical protein
MGMDLCPKRRKPPVAGIRYNLMGWATLYSYLKQWNVDVREFSAFNDGEPISAKTCMAVAKAIEEHFQELSRDDRAWLRGHAGKWRALAKAGGCRQW